mgnify:CR=1 FL=1|jgi:hypothetical protein
MDPESLFEPLDQTSTRQGSLQQQHDSPNARVQQRLHPRLNNRISRPAELSDPEPLFQGVELPPAFVLS